MINMLEKGTDNLIDTEEFFRIVKNCIFYNRDYRRINEIYRNNFIEKVNKNYFFNFFNLIRGRFIKNQNSS